MKKYLILILLMILLAACNQFEETADGKATAVPEPTATAIAMPDTVVPEPVVPVDGQPSEAVSPLQPIAVTYFTPTQQEGPYYTVEKPTDRDNDLVDFASATGAPSGQELYFSGIVYDANGLPLEGITVEIWQTDGAGVYLHPQDPSTASRDPNFQFYGESITAADGVYSFRTILPGLYEPRPRHIHVKVKLDGQELLTTQFYFAGEIELQGDDASMLISTTPAENDAGKPILVGERDIILSIPISN